MVENWLEIIKKMAILAGWWGWLPIDDEYAALL
jgi:hypothetical protein